MPAFGQVKYVYLPEVTHFASVRSSNASLSAGIYPILLYESSAQIKFTEKDDETLSDTIECAVCEKEISLLDEYNGEPMCEDCYADPKNEVFD